jgi:hypothetical protein
VKTATGWKHVAELKGSSTGRGFGDSVAVSGTTVIVGEYVDRNTSGWAYVFEA